MKKVALPLGIIACALIVGPKIISGMVASKYQEIYTRVSENPSINIVEHSYDGGWFSSVSTTKFKLLGLNDDVAITATESLQFGPVIFSSQGVKFALSHSVVDLSVDLAITEEEEVVAFTNKLKDNALITSTISYGFDYQTQINIKETEHEQEGNSVIFKKLDGKYTLSNEQYISGELNWQGFDFKGPEANVQLGPIETTFQQELVNGDLYAGNALMTGNVVLLAQGLAAQDTLGESLLNVDKLTINASSQLTKELMDIHFNYAIDDISGQGHQISNLNVDISFNQLNSAVLGELNTIAEKMQIDPDNATLYAQELMITAGKLLPNDPQININDLSVTTPEGDIKSDLHLSIDPTIYDANNPMSIIPALKSSANAYAPMSFFTKLGLDEMVNMYIEQGLIVQEKDILYFVAQLNQGQLTVNGNVIPL